MPRDVDERTLLARLDELHAKATAGLWIANGCAISTPSTPTGRYRDAIVCTCPGGPNDQQQIDAMFIASLRNAYPALRAVVEAARAFKSAHENSMGDGTCDDHECDCHELTAERKQELFAALAALARKEA